MADKLYGEMTVKELLEKARSYTVGDQRGAEVRAELERQVWIKQIEEANAQISSARFQGVMVFLTFLIVVATITAPWIARHVQ
jgi:hypothetical protein